MRLENTELRRFSDFGIWKGELEGEKRFEKWKREYTNDTQL